MPEVTRADMTDATPTIEEMVTAVLPHLNWAEGNVQRCAERVAARTMSSEALAAAENNATALRAAIATLSSLSPLIEAARRVKNALECIGPLPGASDAQVRELKEATGAMMRALSTFPAPASPWRPVSAELPPIGQHVLIYRPDDDRRPVCEAVRLTPHQGVAPWYWSTPITAHGDSDAILPEHVSMWRSLPAPPTTSDGGEG